MALSLVALSLNACAGGGSLPKPGYLPPMMDAAKASDEKFRQENGEIAVRHIPIAGNGLVDVRVHSPLSPALRDRKIEIQFPDTASTLNDLITALSANDVQVAFAFNQKGGSSFQAPDVAKSSAQAIAGGTSGSSNGAGGNSGGGGGAGSGVIASILKANNTPGGNKSKASANNTPQKLELTNEHLKRALPFISYRGNIGGLMDALQTGMGLVCWQEGQMIFLSDVEQYEVTLPQDPDAIDAVAQTLKDMGATNIITSLEVGRVIYSATASTHRNIIGPYLKKVAKNLATINMQVAVVNLNLSNKSGSGFDWSQFSAALDSRASAISAANGGTGNASGASTSTSTSGTSSGPSPLQPALGIAEKGVVANMTASNLVLGSTNIGSLFGIATVSSVSAAIQWLSTFGNTNISQHVNARTLSGKAVEIASLESIPYVTGVGVGSIGSSASGASGTNNSSVGTANTSDVNVGIDLSMVPRFDSDSETVTIDFSLSLSQLVAMVQLSAGSQLGTLTQPETTEQVLTDVIRMRAGQTVIIGGIQSNQEQYTGNEPTVLADFLKNNQLSTGARNQDVERNALFVIIRPTVTIYETGASR